MKGSVFDIIFVFAVILILSIVTIFGYVFMSTVNDRFQESDFLPEQAKATTQAGVEFFVFWDYLIIFSIMGSFIATLITASQLRAHPVFFIGALLFLVVILAAVAQFSNMFLEFANNPTIAEYAIDYPLTIQFYQNAPLFVLVFTILVMFAMFIGGRSDQSGLGL